MTGIAHTIVLMVIAISTSLSGIGSMAAVVNRSISQEPTRELLAALALHASTSSTRPFEESDWVMLPEGATMTSPELVERLKEIKTPLQCSASRLGAHIAVSCEAQDSSKSRARRLPMVDQLSALAEQSAHLADSPVVLVRVGGLFRLANVDVVVSFLVNYRVLNTIMGLSADDPRAQAMGAIARLSIGPGGEASLEESDDSFPQR